MRNGKNLKLLPILAGLSILAIAAFQYYWLKTAYEREDAALEWRTNSLFRETVWTVQANKLKLDRFGDSARIPPGMGRYNSPGDGRNVAPNQRVENMIDVVMRKVKDSSGNTAAVRQQLSDSLRRVFPGRRDRMMQFLFDMDSLQDTIKIRELDSAYQKRLDEQKPQRLDVAFEITRRLEIPREMKDQKERVFNEVTIGFHNPITYSLTINNRTAYVLKRILTAILFSVFLIAFTALTFNLLYRNLLRQNRLANIKNDFISNITHELKTPIATVSVAIEALRSFNAKVDPERTKEYLDISANELQRLSLLVDKVLKLSMFEKKEVDLQYEVLDMKDLVQEVTSSLRLQFEKHNAQVNISSEGNTSLEGDRLHLVSVIFNLLDNAIKYSSDAPKIDVKMTGDDQKVNLVISDAGIGIPEEYKRRIFEKFFRVPTGNLHNAKGYGLGLSYVAHVVNKHNGHIAVESVPEGGSKFIITLPKHKS